MLIEKKESKKKIWYSIYGVFISSLFETTHRGLPFFFVNGDMISMKILVSFYFENISISSFIIKRTNIHSVLSISLGNFADSKKFTCAYELFYELTFNLIKTTTKVVEYHIFSSEHVHFHSIFNLDTLQFIW